MRKIKIEIISGILSAVMILSSLPVTVFADKNTDENTVPTVTSEIITSEPSTETEAVYEEIETEPIDENVTSIPEDETGSSQVDLDEDIDPLIDETTETSEATEETTETSETTEAPVELIVFDHYYSEIDESVVNTSDLFVQTSDASVFASNTNVVSNYDDVYIIACDSVEEARYVYSYYVGKVDNITDLASVISIASEDNEDNVADLSNINNGEDAISNLNEIDVNDYSEYIALIDTGADADVNFSVVGDNTTDSNGHGTAMLGYIREENPDARVMSIKVFDDSNTTNAANVYAGIKLAIESNVSVINLSLVGADIEQNAIVKEVIQEAIDNDIIVIGAAGNYNLNAANYIPGCIDGVITVGAVNEDGTKYATSNYNADLYVIATSTSEAAARYSGIYTSGNSSDKVYGEYIIPAPAVTPTAAVTPVPTSVEDDFEIAATSEELQIYSTNNLGTISPSTLNLANYAPSGNDYGICFFTGSGDGIGTVGSFVSGGHAPNEITIDDFGSDLSLRSVCARHWGEDESRGARSISGTNVKCWYESSYDITYDSINSVYTVEFVIRLSQRPNMTSPQWSLINTSIRYNISSESHGSGLTRYFVSIGGGDRVLFDEVYGATTTQKIAGAITSYLTNYITAGHAYSGNRDIRIIGSVDPSDGDHTVSYNYETSSDTQVFRAQLVATTSISPNYINADLAVHKVYDMGGLVPMSQVPFVFSVTEDGANTACTNYITTYQLVNNIYNAARPGRNYTYSDLLGKLRWVDDALENDEIDTIRSLVHTLANNENINWDLDALGCALLGRSDWTHNGTGWDTVDQVLEGVLNSEEFTNRYYNHSSIPAGTSIIYTDNNGIAINPIGLGTITSNSPTTATQTYYYREIQSNRSDADTDTNLYRVVVSATGTYSGTTLASVTYNRSVYNNNTGSLLYQGSTSDRTDIRLGNAALTSNMADADFVDTVTVTYDDHALDLVLRTNKIDDASNPARGATFTVYSDAACTTRIGTFTQSGNNLYAYDFGPIGAVHGLSNSFSTMEFTYYIKETSPATQVLINGTWQDANFGANDTVYSVTFTWNPNNDTISGQSATGGTITSSLDNNNISVTATFGTSNGNTVNVPYNVPIEIYKIDEAYTDDTEARHYLSGAEFTIYADTTTDGVFDGTQPIAQTLDANGNVVNATVTETVDENGHPVYVSDPLHVGSYFVVETKAPDGYAMIEGESVQRITINAVDFAAPPVTTNVNNTCRNYIYLTKVDKLFPEVTLEDAVFTVYRDENGNGTVDENDTLMGNMVEYSAGQYRFGNPTTLRAGDFSAGLPKGTYLVVETEAPMWNGERVFEARDFVWSVTIDEDIILKDGYEITDVDYDGVWNDAFGSITINKVEEANRQSLAGAEFTIYNDVNENGTYEADVDTVYAVRTTTSTGIISLEHMPRGQYIVKETAAPEYYETDPNYYVVTISLDKLNWVVDNITWAAITGVSGEFVNRNPIIGTSLTDVATVEHVGVNIEVANLIDVVEYNGLHVGETYVMEGVLYDKNTGEIYLDAEGNEVRNSVTFTPETESGSVEVPFSFPVEQRAISVVAAEKVRHENEENYVGIHYDLTDENQEVDFPGIHTTLLNNVTEEHIAPNMGTITLVDTVTYENIVPNLEYTLYGTIMIKETNSLLRDSEGNVVEIRRTFTPTTSTGDVEVEFTINTAELEGKTLVAFETLECNGVTLVVHDDINDEDQTVYVPDVQTTAVDSVDNDKIIDGASHEQTIIDTVAYTNLIPGITYTVTGKLVVKKDYAEGEEYEYVKDADGNIITSSTTFTPTTANGSVDVIFTIDASIYAGEQIVVFEDVYYNNNLIISHSDINDEDQTIEISLLLHVKIAKADKDNVAYYLKNAEITIFNADGTIAYDVDGNPCVGITNENGEVEFNLVYDRENTYYAQETKAPAGYSINPEKFEIIPTSDRESEGVCLIPVTILDTIIIIPPKTGDNMNLGLYIVLTVLSTCGLAGGCFYFFKRRKKKHNA